MSSHIKRFFQKITLPTSQNEDKARREFILNILLVAVIGLSLIIFTINLIDGWFRGIYVAVSAGTILIPLFFFASLYFLSRKGFSRLASYCLLFAFFLIATYEIYSWGVDLPAALLTYVLVIVMAGILISTRFAFIITISVSITLAIVSYIQVNNITTVDLYWKKEPIIMADFIVFAIIFFIIATVSWLSNREIEKSLKRARKSEAELKKERDMLEVTVERRTKELRETQAEKMGQLYRFAEFGRISSGLFHDLINPLNAVSLNIEKVKTSSEESQYVDRAISAAKKLENLVASVRKQLVRQENKTIFSLNEEVEHVIDVLSHKAEKARVEIQFSSKDDIKIFGDAIRFNQIVLNLVANAIDAYLGEGKNERIVAISLNKGHGKIVLKVTDYGLGIPDKNIEKIFEPFFTTKTDQGIGLGLSMTKRIVEKDFGGVINVSSKIGDRTIFTVELPDKNEQKPSSSN